MGRGSNDTEDMTMDGIDEGCTKSAVAVNAEGDADPSAWTEGAADCDCGATVAVVRLFIEMRLAAKLAAARTAAWYFDTDGDTPLFLLVFLLRMLRPAAVLVLLVLLVEEFAESERWWGS